MYKNDMNIDDINDNHCALVVYLAEHILAYKNALKNKKTDKETVSVLNAYIEEYTDRINKYTNNSADSILIWVKQINNARKKLDYEDNTNKRDTLHCAVGILKESIKKKVLPPEKFSKSSDSNVPKTDSFRKSKKVNIDPISQANQISKMCEEHQKELKEEEDKNKEIDE